MTQSFHASTPRVTVVRHEGDLKSEHDTSPKFRVSGGCKARRSCFTAQQRLQDICYCVTPLESSPIWIGELSTTTAVAVRVKGMTSAISKAVSMPLVNAADEDQVVSPLEYVWNDDNVQCIARPKMVKSDSMLS